MESTPVRGGDAALAMDVLRRIVRALRVFTHATEREFGVSAAQFFVLRQLAARPGQSLGELASRTRTSPSSVSEVAAALVKRGLVVRGRADDDHRRAEFTLTAEGLELLEHAPVSVQEQLVAGFERLPSGEQRVLREGLEAWLEASGLSGVPADMFFEGDGGPRPAG
ncbi:MAG TPA: MarR family transcriptional regulator [Gemmatimonadaceae bacterium]|nr:MarR family transcriptional regulator [Gemmatimonadaceae bacterium]